MADRQPALDQPTQEAQQRLCAILRQLGAVTVAFSGGVDSSYLLAAALDCLGRDRAVAVTIISPLLTSDDQAQAREIAALVGARHRLVEADELDVPEIAANPPDRCYYCKRHRFTMLQQLVAAEHLGVIVHGENLDDRALYRPGSRAAEELGVRAPLAEAGLTKAQIRALARARGLPNWDRQPDACLATRFPYHTPLDRAKLQRVAAAERSLHRILGNGGTLRVRDHGDLARIEVAPADIARLADERRRQAVVQALGELGYAHITLDLEGYRMGSYDERF